MADEGGKAASEYRYNRLTWAEMDEAIGLEKVVLLPTGSTEQHGRHLPLDVDVFLCEQVCLEIGRRAPDRVLVLPPVAYGLNRHHIDFPGTIHIEPAHAALRPRCPGRQGGEKGRVIRKRW